MWEHYRRTFFPMQILIVSICLALHFYWHVPAIGIVVFALVMEFSSVVGSAWAARLRRKIARSRGTLL